MLPGERSDREIGSEQFVYSLKSFGCDCLVDLYLVNAAFIAD